MANIETINVGLAPNDKKGDPLRDAMQKVNRNNSALAAAIDAVMVPTPVFAGVDLNSMTTSGVYHQGNNASAASGANYPIPYAGLLEVFAIGSGAQQFIYQFYTGYRSSPANSRRFCRTYYGSVWGNWVEIIQLDGNGRLPAAMAPVVYSPTLPTTAHDLNDYTTPGNFYQAAVAGATAPVGVNYPVAQVGFLEVVATGSPVLQVYTTRSSISAAQQRFWRVRVSTSSWTAWKEVVDSSATLSYAGLLPAGQDLSTYASRGIWFANAASIATSGANYPVNTAGWLTVLSASTLGAPGQATGVKQRYESVNGKTYTRYLVSGTWTAWLEDADHSTALMNQGGIAAGVDLNTYTQRGMWTQGSSAAAASGSNYPIANSGFLVVMSAGYPGGTTATSCAQVYHAANSNRSFFRTMVNSGWTPWEETVRSSLLGAAGGVATLTATGTLTPAQAPIVHSSAITAGTDANTLTTPGLYYLNSDAQATAALNWPIVLAGTLSVEAAQSGNSQVTQTYTTRNGTGGVLRTFKRVRFGTSNVWGVWQEQARFEDAMTHTFLSATTDANTLIADNTFYTWTAQAVVGANFPASYKAAGYMQVFWQSSSLVSQELTLLVSGAKPRKYARWGNPSTDVWHPWKVTAAFDSALSLPAENCGDIQVEGALGGVYRWNAPLAAYVPAPPTPMFREGLRTEWTSGTAITVNPGRCASSGGELLLELLAANTRTIQTTGTFAHAATGNGLLAGARAANTWYYVFLLRRNSDGAICVAFDTTFNCANRPSTHSHFRRVGCVITDATNNLWAYYQYGNEFWLDSNMTVFSGAEMTSNTVYTPNTYTPPNVAHIIRFNGFLVTPNGGATLLMRRLSASRRTAWTHVLSASNTTNSIGHWEVPIRAIATPTVEVMAGTGGTAVHLFITGFTDCFED